MLIVLAFPLTAKQSAWFYFKTIWQSNLSLTGMIEERIQKARKAFFQFGSILDFQGNLSPVSTC